MPSLPMKAHPIPFFSLLAIATGLGLARPTQAAPPKSAPPPAAQATNAAVAAEVQIPQSLFVVPASPKEGCNPFFPNVAQQVAPTKTNAPMVAGLKELVLNGITSPPKRSAMINGRTFEVGEEGEVRLPNGTKALIKCAAIADDSAVVLIGGQRRELRLRNGI